MTDLDDAAVLGLLTFDGALLGAFGLGFTPLYSGGVPVPAGALLTILILPWLVTRAAEIDPRPGLAGSPLIAWVAVIIVLGFTGPGGGILLPATWQSSLLVVGGLAAGLLALYRALNSGFEGPPHV